VQDGFVILTNGKKVVMINQHFLDFLGYKTFILFTQQHDCVCDYFINEPDFIHKTDNWIEDITNSLHNDAKVKMNNIQTGGEHIFLIRASSFDETRFIITFTDITEIETYKKILENQALTDGLTSLFNRRYFNKILPREISRANRENKKFVFMMLDIDNFKQYNDIYGHQAGDDALIQVAHTIQKSFNRGSDYAFRLGGEEFGVIFSFETLHATQNKIEQLRTNIENLQIEHNASTVSSFITVSIGAVVSDGTESLETLYALADERLYQAKRNGKNRFIY
jgi:diguanylate cyclase (GGDEF)-like protein